MTQHGNIIQVGSGPIYLPSHTYTASDAPPVAQWVENMIPALGSTLLFGAAGVGKTALVCNLLNSVASNQQFLGRNTNQALGMFLSLDTPGPIVIQRWLKSTPQFKPAFHFVPRQSFNVLDTGFINDPIYIDLGNHVREHKIQIVVVDSLRDTFNGDMNNDDIAKQVYNFFQQWLGCSVIFIHHTRKQQIVNGKTFTSNIDDEATGSKYWINKAQVALFLKRLNGQVLSLQMGKSQCFQEWDDQIRLALDGMNVFEYDEAKQQADATTYGTAEGYCASIDLHWKDLTEKKKEIAISQYLKKSLPTVRRYKAAFKRMIP